MPFCETCDRFYNPNSLQSDGTCPACGRQVGDPSQVKTEDASPVPWHFKLLVLVVVLYLGWRLVQGVVWVAQRL